LVNKTGKMKIKVCGMRDQANIKALAELSPDYMGLIFYPESKRFADGMDRSVLEGLLPDIKITGVFVNESPNLIISRVKEYHLQAIQLHGQESPEYCERLKHALHTVSTGIELIKAIGIDDDFKFNTLSEHEKVIDFFLFDTKSPDHGGTGRKFNWDTLTNYISAKPYFLSGGIGLDDLHEIKKLSDERLYAVDLNSRFEIRPAFKDMEQVKQGI